MRALVVALIALAAAGCTSRQGEEELDFRATVSAEPARRGEVERVLETTGAVRAAREAKVVAETGGKLRVGVDPKSGERLRVGDSVTAGQLVASVDSADAAAAARLSAKAEALRTAKAEHARTVRLQSEGVVSQELLDQKKSHLATARGEYDAALLQSHKSQLLAPLAGVLTKVTTSADGEVVPSGVAVAEVMDFRKVLVDLDLGASEVLDVRPGQRVRLHGGPSSSRLEGVVARVAPAIDTATRTFRVEVEADNAEGLLRPGMLIKADLIADAHADVVVVPTSAVVERDGRLQVFVVEAQRVQLRTVEIGLASDDVTEIVSGVKEGERVVVTGQETLQDGTRVIVRS